MKAFLISIDTEGDNLWDWHIGDPITTNNAGYISRFQSLCNDYGFKPTYLTNYEMISDDAFRKWLRNKSHNHECEVGMHLHAWSTPPYVELHNRDDEPAQSYLIEYEYDVMRNKIQEMTNKLSDAIDKPILTHRAGRWAMNEQYFSILSEFGYKIDCSVTPHVNWSMYKGETIGSKGSDYSKCSEQPYIFETCAGEIIEIPVTIRSTSKMFLNSNDPRSLLSAFRKAIKGQKIWLRPNGKNLKQMMWLINNVKYDDETDYIMFMLHSSELMPGGSPYFKTEESIENLYSDIQQLFKEASNSFCGCTIGEYGLNFYNTKRSKLSQNGESK